MHLDLIGLILCNHYDNKHTIHEVDYKENTIPLSTKLSYLVAEDVSKRPDIVEVKIKKTFTAEYIIVITKYSINSQLKLLLFSKSQFSTF